MGVSVKQFVIIVVFILLLVFDVCASDVLQEADDWYAKRGTNFNSYTLKADSRYIQKSIELYKKAFKLSSGGQKRRGVLETHTRLLFHGEVCRI